MCHGRREGQYVIGFMSKARRKRHDMHGDETGSTGITLSVCLIVFRVSFIIK